LQACFAKKQLGQASSKQLRFWFGFTFMNQSPLPKILLGVLALIAALTAFYSFHALNNGSELREFQTKLSLINQRLPIVNAVAVDLLEYSKKNPAIDPLLEAYGIKQGKGPIPGAAPAPTTVPNIKPPTK
jgi:hypothetical protein